MLTQAPKGNAGHVAHRRAPLAEDRGGYALCMRAGRLPRDPHADVRAHGVVRARRGRRHGRGAKGDVHLRGQGRALHHPQARRHGGRGARLHRAPPVRRAVALQTLLRLLPQLPLRKAAGGAAAPVPPERRGGLWRQGRLRGRGDHRSGAGRSARVRHRGVERAHQLHRLSPVPRGLSGGFEGVPRRETRLLVQDLQRALRAQSPAHTRLQGGRAQTHRRAGDAGLPVRGLPRPLRRPARVSGRAGRCLQRRSPHRARAGLLHQDRV